MNQSSNTTKEAKSERTKRRITDAYLDLIASKSWDKISVKEICTELGITRGTFYQYFNDIYDMMEQLEVSLLEDIKNRYHRVRKLPHAAFPMDMFLEKFDYAPPEIMLIWFNFCKDHKKAVIALLNRKNGDPYFVKRLKAILSEHINYMMDYDGIANDALRDYFVKIFLELHMLSAVTWLEEDGDSFMSVKDIVNLLNTMRVGGCYLMYKESCSPDFYEHMQLPDYGADKPNGA